MKKNIRFLLFFLIIGLMLAWPIHTLINRLDRPAEEKQLAALDHIAQELLTHTKKGELEEAQEKIRLLAERFPQQRLPVSLRIDSLNAVTQSILAAKNSFAMSSTSDQLLWHATRVRIAIDALTHDHQPMWRSYYVSYATQMQNLMESAVERNFDQFRQQFDENTRLYLAIKPAMSIHLREEQIKQIDAAYDLISKELRRSRIEWQMVRNALRDLNGTMQSAFIGKDQSAIALLIHPASPFPVFVAIVGAVLLTLAYVAWKKYRGQMHSA
ncbi:sporulation protein [Brevibacillus sp. LEMMJ03]|uniref:sporulation protein YpjB n=1 Tax=Brevibacillus sp. LEMMJ03 TaxID=2595056 RepID=UPI001181100D|nr:sporulation protein YpjB [Brevibacillus sp. LEMMJ03]TRY28166.1 sporulation protein [Brevibacillus sp. LEMMJ03]